MRPRPNSNRFQARSARTWRDRLTETRETKERFLIVCEGTKTEVNYFSSFKVPGRVLQVKGAGRNTLSLVEYAIGLKTSLEKTMSEGGIFDQCWCVFDRDSFPSEDFNNAIARAEAHDFQVAYSNEAFELWYLLHFHYYDTRLSRKAYRSMLTELFGTKYDKSGDYYAALRPRQPDAIRNSKRLLEKYTDVNSPNDCCPATTVHLLVEELNKSVS